MTCEIRTVQIDIVLNRCLWASSVWPHVHIHWGTLVMDFNAKMSLNQTIREMWSQKSFVFTWRHPCIFCFTKLNYIIFILPWIILESIKLISRWTRTLERRPDSWSFVARPDAERAQSSMLCSTDTHRHSTTVFRVSSIITNCITLPQNVSN